MVRRVFPVSFGTSSSTATSARNRRQTRFFYYPYRNASRSDYRGNITDFTYNGIGKLVSKQDPYTNVTKANGYVSWERPITYYVYDLTGALVGTTDANGNTTTEQLVYGPGGPRLAKEFHPDGGTTQTGYDIFGDVRASIDELGREIDTTYDKMGRVVRVDQAQRTVGTASYVAGRAYDLYQYDAVGNRIAHTNTLGYQETYNYDSQGRVVQWTDFAGFATSYSYTYVASIVGAGGVQVGGFQKLTRHGPGVGTNNTTDNVDYFGHTTWHQDMGGHQFTYNYNNAGWLTSQTGTSGQNISYGYYYNGYIATITDAATGALTSYQYDNEGNRTVENYAIVKTTGVDYYENATIVYDELNRIKTVTDPKATISFEYDAVGNRRRIRSDYVNGVNGLPSSQEFWYAYDPMNRFKVSKGVLSGGVRGSSATDATVAIVQGASGVLIGYDKAGQRLSALSGTSQESYTYTADGYLENVTINGVLRAQRVSDLAGRVIRYSENAATGVTNYSKTSVYDADNRVTSETDSLGTTLYDYITNATGQQWGALYHTKNTQGATITDTYYSYEYWDDAKQSTITSAPEFTSWWFAYPKPRYCFIAACYPAS